LSFKMSLIAAAQEDIDAGKHSALPDKLFLLTLDDSIVPAQEKKDIKDQLLDGIKTNSKHFKTVATFTKQKRPCRHHSSHKPATMGWQKRYQRLLPLHHQWWC
jgi:hypothetical protein